jgi:hypothetical protein
VTLDPALLPGREEPDDLPAVLPLVAASVLALLLGVSVLSLPFAGLALAAKATAARRVLRGEDAAAAERLGLAIAFEGLALAAWGLGVLEPSTWVVLVPGLVGWAATWAAWRRAALRAQARQRRWGQRFGAQLAASQALADRRAGQNSRSSSDSMPRSAS